MKSNYIKLTTIFKNPDVNGQDTDKNQYILYNKEYVIKNLIAMERTTSIRYQSANKDNVEKHMTQIQFLTGLYTNVKETPEEIIKMLEEA